MLWKYVWVAITPSLLLFAVIFTALEYKPLDYGAYVFPDWSAGLGLALMSISLLPIPITALRSLLLYKRDHPGVGLWEAAVTLSEPRADWGPALPQHRFSGHDQGEDDVFA